MTKRSGTLLPANLIAAWLMLASAWQVLAVDPVVSNVHAKQREGSRLVDITYDVADPDSPTLTVYLKVSADGGKTWKGPVELVIGDVGQHIAPGTAKRLVWDAGKEMPNQFGVKFRYRIGASDQWLVPDGMALIPAGPFQMGDDRVEGPVHTVTVSAFAMDKWEVSIELWESVREWANAHGYTFWPGQSDGAKHPVYGLDWWTIVKWCNARSEKEGLVPAYYLDKAKTQIYRNGYNNYNQPFVNWDSGYRLPTEAEWEKAARGGVSGKLYPWGTDEISPSLANYGDSKNSSMPVGSYGANGYGLYDMAGNMWEFCWDWFGDYSSAAQTDPRGPSSGERLICRGGHWVSDKNLCRVANRYTGGVCGFRCALTASQP